MIERFNIASQFVNTELERKLLAAIVQNPEIYWQVIDLLPPEAMAELGQVYDQVATAIEKNHPIPMIEGLEEETITDPVEAAKEIADLYQKRLLADATQSFLQELHGNDQAMTLVTKLEERLNKVQQAVKDLRAGQLVPVPDLLPDLLKDVTKRYEKVKAEGASAIGLPTGIKKLDTLLGGLQAGIHLVAAEPGQGKTTFTLQVSGNVAQAGYPVLFVSFEESLTRLTLKALCQVAGLEIKQFADGYGDPKELEKAIFEHGHKLNNLHLIEGSAKLTVAQIKAKALQLMKRMNTDKCLIVVDYLQRWASMKKDFADFRHVVGGLVAELRDLSLRLDSPIVLISSQNRGGQGSNKLTSLKESGDLEYGADTALFLTAAEERVATPPNRGVDLSIEKNRYGDKGKIELVFRPHVGSFREESKR